MAAKCWRADWDIGSHGFSSDRFLGRLFETPDVVFTEEMLRPEKQGMELFAAGVDAIVEAQRRVALNYFEDGSVDAACPPLKALLHIMAHGEFEGMTLNDPRFRGLFDREVVLASDWYKERLRTKQQRDVALWQRHLAALQSSLRMAMAPVHRCSTLPSAYRPRVSNWRASVLRPI